MTTYNGRSANYIPGKEVVNKEPPVSKFVVEKLYRVHRERIGKIEPTIDSHVKIPDFLTNQSWKKAAEKQKRIKIARHNQEIYDRISKVENSESAYTSEQKQHVKRIELKATYLKKLKEHGRLVHLLKIQKENEYLLRRIERARPEYTKKKCEDWYKHHELFKAGRRSDPTAGHIMTGMGGLLPHLLPPLSSVASSNQDMSLMSSVASKHSRTLPSLSAGSLETDSQLMVGSATNSIHFNSNGSHVSSMPPRQSSYGQLNRGNSTRSHTSSNSSSTHLLTDDLTEMHQTKAQAKKARETTLSFASFIHKKETEDSVVKFPFTAPKDLNRFDSAYFGTTPNTADTEPPGTAKTDDSMDHIVHANLNEDLILITSKPFTIPFDSKNCLVQVFTSKVYDENLYLKVVSSGIAFRVYSERSISIDKAYDIVNAGGHSNQIVHSADGEDLSSLSSLLINMFKEADDNGDGFLTFDEFQLLMEKVELGISAQELRFVISEADENENGVVDYDEFVELGVDLIQSFRARNKAKNIVTQQDVMLDEQIMRTISTEELESIADACLDKIYEFDTKKYGLIRIPELKRSLAGVGNRLGDNELSLICQMLPRDQFGRCKYNTQPNTFLEILSKVRFATMKNTMVEQNGSGLQKYLLDLCREEEAKIEQGKGLKEKFVATGIIPCRALINMLNSAPRLSLSRLQVLVIMSEASVLDGMINYYQFIPVVAKAIEIMFEPKALRQRAELILKTDLSPEALLNCMHTETEEVFEQRVKTLFKSFDIDNSEGLDQNEFIACLEALELQLTFGEMVALFENADDGHVGHLRFIDFVVFFSRNLLNLEKERHIRLLQTSMHTHNHVHHHITADGQSSIMPIIDTTLEDSLNDEEFESEFIDQLTAIFKLSDENGTGCITYEEFESILKNFSINISRFLMEVMLSELHMTEEGMVDYNASLSTCADLLKVFRAKESAIEEHKEKEAWAEIKANDITQSAVEDVNHIVRFLRNKIKHINENTNDIAIRYNELHNLFRNPHSGLSRYEANTMIARLLNGVGASVASSVEGLAKRPKSAEDDKEKPLAMSNYGADTMSPTAVKTRIIPKNFKGVFTTHELFDAVFEARKLSIMRGLLQEVDHTVTQQMIFHALEREAAQMKVAGLLMVDSTYLPVKMCFAVLEKSNELRLNRAQIMFIISWAECFDKDGTSLDIAKFADHASSIISKLNVPAMLETRAEVMNNGGVDERKVLNGMKMKDLESHLENEFDKAANDQHEITHDQLWRILKEIPRIKLSDRETTTIAAAFHSHEAIKWRDILSSTVTTIRSLCKERVINRRVSLAVTATSNNNDMGNLTRENSLSINNNSVETKSLKEESLRQVKQLSDKLLNFVKIQLQGDNIVLTLPSDVEKRRSSQVSTDIASSAQGSKELSQLFRGVRMLPMVTFKTVSVAPALAGNSGTGVDKTSPATGMRRLSNKELISAATKPAMQVCEVKSQLPVMIRIVSVEDTQMYSAVSLVANIIDVSGEFTHTAPISVRLPSLGLVDREAAEQFALNVVDKFSIECRQGVLTLKISE